jgi:diamine N-acetyltransferase
MENALIRITAAGKEDAALIADLSRRTFYDTFAPHNTPENMNQFLSVQFTREQLMAEVGAPHNVFLLAWLGQKPAGYARLYEGNELPHELAGTAAIEISRFYSERHAIGKGVGQALMEACLSIAGAMGKEWIWLCVWEHNLRAIRFYEKMGFREFDRHIFVLGQDIQHDWKMKRKV